LRNGGHDYSRSILELLGKAKVDNEIIIELCSPDKDGFLANVGKALKRWSVEITLESHDERIRRLNKRFACTNKEIEETIEKALKNGAGRVDIFFMVGLPGQSYDDAVSFDEFCRKLLERFNGDRRLEFFVAPLAPFLDPGSAAFENAGKHGYKLRFHTLEEHRRALTSPSWKEMLNYETDSMTRNEIVRATYESMRRLTRLKRDWELIDEQKYKAAMEKINASEAAAHSWEPRTQAAATAAIFQKKYLIWPLINGHRFASLPSLTVVGLEQLISECKNFVTRRLPLYFGRHSSG
jgi:radical SAM superfamily enzyme YgiQ (UPF0313 family)